jgi:hypothetical protein
LPAGGEFLMTRRREFILLLCPALKSVFGWLCKCRNICRGVS